MQDFDRTLELVNISQESAGATTAQQVQFMQGMEAATINLRTAYQNFITAVTDSEILIGIIRGIGSAVEMVTKGIKALGFEGPLAMTALTGLFLVLKFGKDVKGMYNRITGRASELRAAQNTLLQITNTLSFQENILLTTKTAILEQQRILSDGRVSQKNKEIAQQRLTILQQQQENALKTIANLKSKETIALETVETLTKSKKAKVQEFLNGKLFTGNIFVIAYNRTLKKHWETITTKVLPAMVAKIKSLTILNLRYKLAILSGMGLTGILKKLTIGFGKAALAVLKFSAKLLVSPIG